MRDRYRAGGYKDRAISIYSPLSVVKAVSTGMIQNDMTSFKSRDDVLTMLIHLGYLGYDLDTGEVFVPNNEIRDEFKASTSSEEWVETFKAFKRSQELLKATCCNFLRLVTG